ncbi:hypothetical protein ACV342_33890, partial [Pseudomonas aeruginosa]
RWPDKESGEEVQALKVEASRISILPHRLAIGRRQQGDLGQAMRKDGNARGFDLQRLYFFARLFVRPA